MSLRSDGIIQTEITDNYDLTIDDARDLMQAYIDLGGGKKYPHLFIFKSMSLADRPVMQYMAEEANDFGVADAIVIDTHSQKILANFYILVQRPKIPTRFFKIKDEAVEWLRGYVN